MGIKTSQAQWEYSYFSLRTGANLSYITPQQTTAPYLLMKNQEGNYQKLFAAKELGLEPIYNFRARPFIELQFNYDFVNDKGGIVSGLNYNSFTLSQNFYLKNNSTPQFTRDITIHSIGIPLYVKFGKGIFDLQRYFFGGVQLNLNKQITVKQSTAWSDQVYIENYTSDHFINRNIQFIFGFNYMIFNVEIDYQPVNFLNKDYVNNDKIAIYSAQKDDILYLKT